jgi:hypothetical protein
MRKILTSEEMNTVMVTLGIDPRTEDGMAEADELFRFLVRGGLVGFVTADGIQEVTVEGTEFAWSDDYSFDGFMARKDREAEEALEGGYEGCHACDGCEDC